MAEREYAIAPAPSSVPPGSVRFTIRNEGSVEHELVVLKTTVDESGLPLDQAKAEAAEEGSGVAHVTEKEGIRPGSTVQLTAKLAPGRYVLICNLPTHYGLGMHATLIVQ